MANYAIKNDPIPYVDAAMRRCFMISSVEYAGSSIWKKHVCASGRISSPPFFLVSLKGLSQLSALGSRDLHIQHKHSALHTGVAVAWRLHGKKRTCPTRSG